MTDYPLVQVCGQGHVARFLKFCPIHVFGIGEFRHFKFRLLVDTEEYSCRHNILLPKEMCPKSRVRFKISEMSDSISETVQDRDKVAKED